MLDSEKTKEQLIAELNVLRSRIEHAEALADGFHSMGMACVHTTPGKQKTFQQSPFERAPIGIFMSTIDGRFLSVNHVHANMHGYDTPEDLIGAVFSIRDQFWVHPSKRDAFIRSLRDNGEVQNFESLRRKRDGTTFWVSTSARLAKYPAFEEPLIEGFVTDITKRKLAEEALREKSAILEAQLNATLDGILIVNDQHKIVLVNQRIKELFNVPAGIISKGDDKPLLELVSSQVKNYNTFIEKVTTLYSNPSGISRDEIEFKNGMLLDRYSAPVLGKDGKYYGRIWIFRDITERTRLQEMMVQTEKMMSLGGLAAGMAHEINNPLGGVLQSVQVLLRRLTQDNRVNTEAAERVGCSFESIKAFMENRGILDSLEGIRESGSRAAQIISSMLEFSRRSDSSHVPADLNAVFDKAVRLCATDYDLKKQYDFRHIRIERDYASRLPRVPCSMNQIEQVILNLLKNAAQAIHARHAGAPPGTIVLRTRPEADRVRFEVKDNGQGMDEQTRRKAFDPFFTTKPVGEGTGLGLSVSYFIITSNHRGTIEVESHPGEGTTFIIRLPLSSDGTCGANEGND